MNKDKILSKLDDALKAKDVWQEAATEMYTILKRYRKKLSKNAIK